MATHHWEPFVFATDNHGDQVNQAALKKFFEFVEDFKPKHRIHGGDLFDLRPMRKGAGPEERSETIELDVTAGEIFLESYRPDTLLLGNHDMRLYEGLHSNCGMTASTCRMMLQKLQGDAVEEPRVGGLLEKLGLKNILPYHVDEGVYPLGDVNFIHGYRATKYPASAHSENWGPSVITGHVHKYDVHVPRHYKGGLAMCSPTLADLDMRYLHRSVAALAHDNGWIFGVVNSRTGKFEAWCIRRQRGDDTWLDPRSKWI